MIAAALSVPTADLLVVGTALLCWGLWLLAGVIAENRAEKRRLRLQREKWDAVNTAEHQVTISRWGSRK